MDESKLMAENREYIVFTGKTGGVDVTNALVSAAEQEASVLFIVSTYGHIKSGVIVATDSNIWLKEQPSLAEKESNKNCPQCCAYSCRKRDMINLDLAVINVKIADAVSFVVSGINGVKWFMERSKSLRLRVYHSIPSCVPASSPELEWTAFVFGKNEVEELSGEDNVLALGEVMDYKRVLSGDRVLKAMVDTALKRGLRVEGHIPTLKGHELSEYVSWGITSDHTLMNPERITERIYRGVFVMLQLKSITDENIRTVMNFKDRSAVLLVTDDVEPSMIKYGHISTTVKKAVEKGMPAMEAIASASIRPAHYLNLNNIGLIAPGYKADFLVVKDLIDFPPEEVYIGGELVAEKGVFLKTSPVMEYEKFQAARSGCSVTDTPIAGTAIPLLKPDLQISKEDNTICNCNAVVIENDDNSLTGLEKININLLKGYPDFKRHKDIALIGVFARNGKSGNVGIVKNLGLNNGAYASTFEHDSHNLMIVGRGIDDMLKASQVVSGMGGGIAVVKNGSVLAELPLPVMGILSDHNYKEVAKRLTLIENTLKSLGMSHKRPFLLLSVLCLSVSPYFKFSNKGIVDTENRKLMEN